MVITSREIELLKAVANYGVLNARQIQRLLFPSDQSVRSTRRRLQYVVELKLLNKHQTTFAHPHSGDTAPVYYLAIKGLQLLAEHFDNDRYLKISTRPPIAHHVWHWLAVAETHIAFDQAIAAQTDVSLDGWINEYDELDGAAKEPHKKYRLYTLIREEPKLVCVPDAAFLLCRNGNSRVFYLEQDRNTSGVVQIAASKTPGYFGMAEAMLHNRHFPQATIDGFNVLMIAPTARRRDTLRRAISTKAGSHLWRFASTEDAVPEKLLKGNIWYPCGDGDPSPLVRA